MEKTVEKIPVAAQTKMILKDKSYELSEIRACGGCVELLFDKIESIVDLLSLPESELFLTLLPDWTAPLDLCASAASSHIYKLERTKTCSQSLK